MDDVPELLDVLVHVGLVETEETSLRLTKAGRKVATQDHRTGGKFLGLALIRSGLFAAQASRLLEVGHRSDIQSLVCPREVAVRVAPQLIGILRRFGKSVSLTNQLTVSTDLVAEISDVWSLLPPPVTPEADYRKDMGNRGELFSYRYCRINADDPAKVRWVARDDESLGYDIEDLNFEPKRRVEVKASAEKVVRFYLSPNELQVARRLGDDYEVHFWGGVSLKASVKEEYERLTKVGYPMIYRGINSLLESGRLSIVPTQYLVTEPSHCDAGGA
ncbi:protein NO VEIN domain-containing protein [Streptomyces cyaneofuscatus]|uniref:protein NO VEIN domain-containing protein n=1 Tax=Streptomyces cyaneofuscatus TaxID=66883 RepID=UPI0036AFECFE